MGLFSRLGRQVEQFKRSAKEAAEEEAEYRCRTCDARFHADHDLCPECGADAVVSTISDE
ncbi:hypothetical protein [Halobaculum magnesiiphilum]|uniref:Small CPxCG-related zinc finger protein n=1 Tax=Halobaculum magnesiiphilum TaxID=1017351 RepID=A0A8T8WEI0_9EURY|nr:hypothetical protein [Halobaculum magnesiiphilum]QZP38134.1 hypothetical protein K6T50_02935 [Halobaculum magnesiiphilum]